MTIRSFGKREREVDRDRELNRVLLRRRTFLCKKFTIEREELESFISLFVK